MLQKKHIPNALTVFRGVATLLIVCLFLAPSPSHFALAYALFILAAISDFADGYLARKWAVVTDFGKVFDPLFDKLLVLTIILLIFRSEVVWSVLLIILFVRDLTTDVFKNYLLAHGITTPAITSAKWKTAMQMLMINFVLLYFAIPSWSSLSPLANIAGAAAVVFSLWSGYIYTRKFWLFMARQK